LEPCTAFNIADPTTSFTSLLEKSCTPTLLVLTAKVWLLLNVRLAMLTAALDITSSVAFVLLAMLTETIPGTLASSSNALVEAVSMNILPRSLLMRCFKPRRDIWTLPINCRSNRLRTFSLLRANSP